MDPTKENTPGGLTLDQVNNLIATANKPILDALKAQGEANAALTGNVKIIADTIAKLPPAKPADEKPAKDKDGKDAKAKDGDAAATPLTDEEINKRVEARVNDAFKAREDEATKKAQRQALVDKVVKEKLGGNAEFAPNLVGDDEASLNASADSLATQIKKFKPDFGGVAQGKGEVVKAPPAGGENKTAAVNLPTGLAAFANSLEIPASK